MSKLKPQRCQRRLICEKCHERLVQPPAPQHPPPPPPPPSTHPVASRTTTPWEPSPDELKWIAALSLISLCSSGPTSVYIWYTIDPDGDDIIFLIKFFGFYVVGAGLLVGILGMLAGICGLFEHHWEKRALAVKAITMEVQDEGDNVEEDDGERPARQRSSRRCCYRLRNELMAYLTI